MALLIKGLIFDFDGLVLDTESPDFKSWQKVFKTFDLELTVDMWASVVGNPDHEFNPLDHIKKMTGRNIDQEGILARKRESVSKILTNQAPLPGVEDYIQDAKTMGLKVGIASSSSHDWVDKHLLRLGLVDKLDTIKCRDDVKRIKPAPDIYLAALEALEIDQHEAIAFEDSPIGTSSAKNAGIFCVAVPNELTKHLPLDHADLLMSSLSDMRLNTLISQINTIRTI